MKFGALAVAVAKKEGHKSQARIADIREILGIISDMMHDDPDVQLCLQQSGIRRNKSRKKRALAAQSKS